MMDRTDRFMTLFVALVPLILAGSYFYVVAIGNQINSELGQYGVKIQLAQGLITTHDASLTLGTWWNGYDAFESVVVQWLVSAVVFGLIVGALAMFALMRTMQKKDEGED